MEWMPKTSEELNWHHWESTLRQGEQIMKDLVTLAARNQWSVNTTQHALLCRFGLLPIWKLFPQILVLRYVKKHQKHVFVASWCFLFHVAACIVYYVRLHSFNDVVSKEALRYLFFLSCSKTANQTIGRHHGLTGICAERRRCSKA